LARKPKTTKKKAPTTKKKPKKTKTTPVVEMDDDGHPDEFVWMELTDDQLENFMAPEEMLETEGLSLGDRLGTISKLEQLEEASIPPIAKKAGLKLMLKGSQICLVPGGEFLSVGELQLLAQWLLDEATKAAEDYAIDFDS